MLLVTEVITVFVLLSISGSSVQTKDSDSDEEENLTSEGYDQQMYFSGKEQIKVQKFDRTAIQNDSFMGDNFIDQFTGIRRDSKRNSSYYKRRESSREMARRESQAAASRFDMRQAIFY